MSLFSLSLSLSQFLSLFLSLSLSSSLALSLHHDCQCKDATKGGVGDAALASFTAHIGLEFE